MYEILSNLPESVAYTCVNCTERHPAEWRLALEKELQASLKQVLTALLNSRTTSHLLRYRQVGRGSVCFEDVISVLPSNEIRLFVACLSLFHSSFTFYSFFSAS